MKVKLKSMAKNVAATGTPEALANQSIITSFLRIKAKIANTQPVLIGDSAAQDYQLAPGAELNLSEILSKSGADEVNLADIYVKVGVNGEGVTVLYGTKPSL